MAPWLAASHVRHVAACKRMAVAPLLLFAGEALATCAPATLTLGAGPSTHAHGVDSIRPGAPLGAGWSQLGYTSTLFDLVTCSAFGARVEVYPAKPPVPGVTYSDGADVVPVYPTGVDGIGYVAQMKDPAAPGWTYLRSPSAETLNLSDWAYQNLGMVVRVLFVVTGPLKSGSYAIPAQTLATANAFARLSAVPLTTPGTIRIDGSTLVTISAGSCRLTTPSSQAVALPVVGQSALTVAGSRAARGSGFHIGVHCDAHVALHITMTDVADPANTGNVLSLTKDSTAAGVGVQVFQRDSAVPVSYGPDSSVPGNANQWLVGSGSTEMAYDLPFTAAYVRTGTVVPGRVQAKATFTFSYQ